MSDEAPLRLGHGEWHGPTRRLLVDGRPALVGSRALELLAAMVDRRERIVGKQELLDLVWPGLVVEENNLQVQVSALRKVLGPDVIATIPGRGYRLTAVAGTAAAAGPAPDPAPPAPWDVATPLVGRAAALRQLTEQLRRNRLVSLVGPGGVGKTRLALAAAGALQTHWRDGVTLVEAAAVADPALLPHAVASALRLGHGAGESPAQLAAALEGRELLLVLDNCEHQVDAAAALVDALVLRAPGVHVLVTSQVRLNLAAEQVMPLAPLDLPPDDEALPDERYGAVQLFVNRARAVLPDFALDAHNARAVADICRRLDGLPLAIELAASRLRLLGVTGLRDRLDDRLRLLTQGARDAPARHQTLQATLAWSHALLDPVEQAVLRRLGLFVGGFSLALAQRVAADDLIDDWAVLEALAGLVDKSLVVVDAGEPVRYRLLESTRAFALDRMADAGEATRLARRHADALCALFVDANEQRLRGDGSGEADHAPAMLASEVGNVRAALQWAMGPDGDPALALALATASANLFMQLGLTLEALPRLLALRPAVEAGVPAAQACDYWRRVAVLGGYGGLSLPAQREAAGAAVDWARRSGHHRRLQISLSQWGHALLTDGHVDEVSAVIAEMRALERPDDPAHLAVGRIGLEVGSLVEQQRFDEAIAALQLQQVLLAQAPGERVVLMISRANLCWVLNVTGRHAEAAALAGELLASPDLPRGLNVVGFDLIYALSALRRPDEALTAARRLRGSWHLSPLALHGGASLMGLCAARGRLDHALRIDGACDAYRRQRGLPACDLTVRERARLEQACADAGIDAAQRQRWCEEGSNLSAEACIALALGEAD